MPGSGPRGHLPVRLSWLLPELPAADSVGHIHTGSIGATLEPGGSQVVRAVREAADVATVSYDPNARPTLMGSSQAVLGRRRRSSRCPTW